MEHGEPTHQSHTAHAVDSVDSTDPRVPLAYQRTDLARERSRWAAERTLMAWIRTSISMISFGFAIDKVIAWLYVQEQSIDRGWGYHVLGIAFVSCGILLLLLSSAEHLIILKRLQRQFGKNVAPLNPLFPLPLFGASLVLLIGAAALLLMLW